MEEFFTSHNILFGMFGAVLAFWMYRIDKKFEKIDQRFDNLGKRFDRIDDELKSIRVDLQTLSDRTSHIEGILWATHGYSTEERRK